MNRLFLFLFFLSFNSLQAQETFRLKLKCADRDSTFFTKRYVYKTNFKDTIGPAKEAANMLAKLRGDGYIAASVDSITKEPGIIIANIFIGQKFQNITILNGNVPAGFLADIGLKKYEAGKSIPSSGTQLLKAKVVQACENIGYPFAEVKLDSFKIQADKVSAGLYLQRHELIRYDTMHIVGKTKAKLIFLKNYLGIKTGKVYDEANVRRINQRLSQLQFIETLRNYSVEFRGDKAKINLFLKDKKASQFNVLVGLLPGSSGQKVLVTGDVKIHLFSPFGIGEELYLQWQKLQPKTQTLNVKVVYPYLLGLPLGINVNFQLYKKDTTYLNLDGDYGVQYQMAGNDYLKASYKQKISIILDPDTNFVKLNRSLPPDLDLSTNEFGLEFFTQRLNYRFNPVSGYVLQLSAAAGARTIKKNNTILSLHDEVSGHNFAFLYDTLRLTTFQMHVQGMIDKFWKLTNRHTFRTMLKGEYLFSRTVLINEMYQIGGTGSLLGFDDKSIYTPYYVIGDFEYRFLLSKNSYFYGFFNSALVKERNHYLYKPFDFPFGFGAGVTFETKVGLFALTYALGRQEGNAISFKEGKIHFGYVNYF